MKKKVPKYRILRNRWDNWYGYEGRRRVVAFGNSAHLNAETSAKEWLEAQIKYSTQSQLSQQVPPIVSSYQPKPTE